MVFMYDLNGTRNNKKFKVCVLLADKVEADVEQTVIDNFNLAVAQ
jgi:hypothetical protein